MEKFFKAGFLIPLINFKKLRLEPNNQLKLLELTQITIADLPKRLYRDKHVESINNQSVGLVGASIFNNWENKQELWIASKLF
jgi:hypothetical protein